MLNIEILKGTRLNAIGRAAAMCWISLGNLEAVPIDKKVL